VFSTNLHVGLYVGGYRLKKSTRTVGFHISVNVSEKYAFRIGLAVDDGLIRADDNERFKKTTTSVQVIICNATIIYARVSKTE